MVLSCCTHANIQYSIVYSVMCGVYYCHVTVAPVAPVSVTVDMSTVTPESAVVTWTPLTDEYTGGFDLVRYIVSYKLDGEEWSVAKTLEVNPDASQVILEGLEPASTYSASVHGVNALGKGFPAVSKAFTTPELSECLLHIHSSMHAPVLSYCQCN